MTHTVRDTWFEENTTGIFLQSSQASLTNVKKRNVITPVTGSGYYSYSGSMTAPLFYTDKSFAGMKNNTLSDYYGYLTINPPDTMAAIGPNHVVEILNGSVVVYDKSNGKRLEGAELSEFFNAPFGDMIDPQIIYDQHCQRWVTCVADRASGPSLAAER